MFPIQGPDPESLFFSDCVKTYDSPLKKCTLQSKKGEIVRKGNMGTGFHTQVLVDSESGSASVSCV